jgi:hypothetical protein
MSADSRNLGGESALYQLLCEFRCQLTGSGAVIVIGIVDAYNGPHCGSTWFTSGAHLRVSQAGSMAAGLSKWRTVDLFLYDLQHTGSNDKQLPIVTTALNMLLDSAPNSTIALAILRLDFMV